jgi:transmembrane sensor
MDDSLPNESDRHQAAGRDGLMDAIRELEREYRSTETDPRAGARMWASIDRATRSGSDRPALRLVRTKRLMWSSLAVAAAIAILLIVPNALTPAGGQVVASAAGEQVVFRTENGSVITLRPHSRLYRMTEDHTFRVDGEAFFDVVHDETRTFRVVTASGDVSVLGTRFNVEAVGVETTVFLEVGSIRFGSGADSVTLVPGQTVHAIDGSVEALFESDGAQEMDWIQGELVFEARTAREVAGELARHYDVRLDIPAGVAEETLSGRILLADSDRALADLALVLGGRFVEVEGGQRFISN